MVLHFPTSEFFETTGGGVNEFNEKLRDSIVTHACNVWSQYPVFITKGRNPVSSFARGYMNSVCRNIQSPPQIEAPPFSGGQCCDKEYIVVVQYQFVQCNGNIASQGTPNFTVTGRILGLLFKNDPPGTSQWVLALQYEDCNGVLNERLVTSTTRQVFDDCSNFDPNGLNKSDWSLAQSTYNIISVATADGSPDDCGSLPSSYPPEPPPSSGDLGDTFNITNIDGTDNNFVIEWNQINTEYNFPMGFKVNGINVVLDIGGLTIFGDNNINSPGGDNTGSEPGSDGGTDEEGFDYVRTYPEVENPVLPDLTIPENVEKTIEKIVCTEGVIEVVSEVLKVGTGFEPIAVILIDMLGQILQDLCGIELTQFETGFPEYYPVLPGADRPCIIFFYKEIEEGQKGRSTYTTTLTHPSPSAIVQFDDLDVPDKSTGEWIASLRLSDGSRLQATGADEDTARANLSFYLGLTSNVYIPANPESSTVVTHRVGVEERVIKCVQYELYGSGKSAGVAPERRRIFTDEELGINQPEE